MLLKSRALPDMLPSSLCNKKTLAIRHMNRPLFPTTLSIPSCDIGKYVGLRTYQHPLALVKSPLFWDVTQRRLIFNDVSRLPIVPIFRGQAVQEEFRELLGTELYREWCGRWRFLDSILTFPLDMWTLWLYRLRDAFLDLHQCVVCQCCAASSILIYQASNLWFPWQHK